MPMMRRPYRYPEDFDAVGRLLVRTYRPGGPHRNWLQPRWEYMHFHPLLDERRLDLGRCAVWEDRGEIVAVVHFEHRMGILYLQIDPRYPRLAPEMLEFAAERLGGEFAGERAVYVYIDDDDRQLQHVAERAGFEPNPDGIEVTSALPIPRRFPQIPVPAGFRIRSLQEGNDIRKVHRILHRGFDHPGEPPEDELDGRRKMQSAPNFRLDLTIIAEAPDGEYASLAGIWIDSENSVAYVEPVATDPDYRRRGLGRAVVQEAVRRCAREGATIAYVGSDQPFYRAIGFRTAFSQTPWGRRLPRPRPVPGPDAAQGRRNSGPRPPGGGAGSR